MGPAYFGGQFGYSSGNDIVRIRVTGHCNPGKDKSGTVSSTSWTPALIFGNANLRSWMYGQDIGNGGANGRSLQQQQQAEPPDSGTPSPVSTRRRSSTSRSVLLHVRRQEARQFRFRQIGYEADVKATYKIYDNLTYMVGAGYLWTGDYFKGTSEANKTGNDYMLMNQLTLNF